VLIPGLVRQIMSDTPYVLDVSTVSIVPGDSWNPTRPEYDILGLMCKCWTSAGQLVHASPNGKIYYVHHGLALLFPINLQYSTRFPVYWMDRGDKRIPFLAAEHDFQPRFGGPDFEVTIENSYPVNPILQITGPALDLHLFGGLSDQLGVEAQVQAAAMAAAITGPRTTSKAVNAFIAYRCESLTQACTSKMANFLFRSRSLWAVCSSSPADGNFRNRSHHVGKRECTEQN